MAPRRLALGGAALVLSIAAPSSAIADPVIAPKPSCIRYIGTVPPQPSLALTTSGWAAGAPLTFAVGGQTIGSGTADPNGAFDTGTSRFTPPEPKGNLESTTLTATDAGGVTASAPVKIVRLIVTVPGGRHKPSAKVKYRVFGFIPGERVYLFVRKGNKTKGRFALGRAQGECGTLTKKLRFMPLRHYTAGVYDFWFSQSKTYSKRTRIYRYRIQISRF